MNPFETRTDTGSLHKIRLFWLSLFSLALLLGLIYRIAYLQIFEYQRFSQLAEGNRINASLIVPHRGRIFDRNGILLAGERIKYNLVIIPEKIQSSMDSLLTQLKEKNFISKEEAQAFKRYQKRFRAFDKIYVATLNSEQKLAQFAAESSQFPGAELDVRLTRYYPHGESLAHLLGYVGRINLANQAAFTPEQKARYKGSLYIGKLGIEAAYEDQLHGFPGKLHYETNAQGRFINEIQRIPAQDGKDLHLTLDYRLHAYAYHLLEGLKGSVVAMDNRTGQILALVSRPAYNPNLFVDGISFTDYNALLNDPHLPLLDRSLQGQYPPGSTFKPFVAFAGLESGAIDPKKKIDSKPFFQLPTDPRKYRDWKEEGHGKINFNKAMAVSSDYFFYDLSNRLGIEAIDQSAERFGFGQKTGIDLPNEKSGLLPTPDWKKMTKNEIWFPGETLITGIGQGYLLATPLQLANATSRLANRGHASASPYLVKPNQLQSAIETQNPQTWPLLQKSMESVVHLWYGTAHGRAGQNIAYRMAGKTGTAQVFGLGEEEEYDESKIEEHLRDHALFIAYAPAENPEISLSVVIENGGSGSKTAAPIARKLLDYYFQLKSQDAKNANGASHAQP